MPLTPAERQRRYRERLKAKNPEKYIRVMEENLQRTKANYYKRQLINKGKSRLEKTQMTITQRNNSTSDSSSSFVLETPIKEEYDSSYTIEEFDPLPQTTPVLALATSNTIILPEFGRAIDNPARCFFPDCHRIERLTIPMTIRRRLFLDLNFYVPPKCRICIHHLKSNEWRQLMDGDHVDHTFTSEEISDFVELIKNQPVIDFEDVQNMDNYLVQYWFGITREEFKGLLEETPQLANMHKGSTAFAAYLLKSRTGGTNENISLLFQMPIKTLEGLIAKAEKILQKDMWKISCGVSN